MNPADLPQHKPLTEVASCRPTHWQGDLRNSFNPYAAPRADLVAPGKPVLRSHWAALRFFLVVYFGLFVVLGLLAAIVMPGAIAWKVWQAGLPAVAHSSQFREMLMSSPACVVLGLVGFQASRAWYLCRWKQATLFSLGFILLIGLGAAITRFILQR